MYLKDYNDAELSDFGFGEFSSSFSLLLLLFRLFPSYFPNLYSSFYFLFQSVSNWWFSKWLLIWKIADLLHLLAGHLCLNISFEIILNTIRCQNKHFNEWYEFDGYIYCIPLYLMMSWFINAVNLIFQIGNWDQWGLIFQKIQSYFLLTWISSHLWESIS